MDIHERIGALPRILNVKNLHQLALSIDLTSQTVANCANGKSKPSYLMIKNLCDEYLNLNARWLVTGQGSPLYELDEDITVSEHASLSKEIEDLQKNFSILKERIRKLES